MEQIEKSDCHVAVVGAGRHWLPASAQHREHLSPLRPATYRHSRTKPSSYYLDVLARPLLRLLRLLRLLLALLLSLRGQPARFPIPWPDMALHYTYITWLHGSHGSYVSSNRLAALYCWSDLGCVPLAECIHPTRKAGR